MKMEFKQFNKQIQKQFAEMCKTKKLFRVNVSGRELWDKYLSSFENEMIFRDPESSVHNCNCCKNFIRRYGNVVAIDSKGDTMSLFSDIEDVGEYTASSNICDNAIKESQISGVFFETYRELNEALNYESCSKTQKTFKLGIEFNLKKYTQEEVDKFGVVNAEKIYEFNHFSVDLPNLFVNFSGDSIERIEAFFRDKYAVFKRAIEEISIDTLNLVKDLINQGSLLDGNAHLHAINAAIICKEEFNGLKTYSKDNWLWETSYSLDERNAKFRNTLIGVLCTELTEGEELNKACLNWNKRVDPANYHKATAPITQRQIEDAKNFVQENGYEDSFNRRLATIEDIKASEILHMNSGDGKIEEVSMFDNVKATSTRHKRSEFKKLDEVSISKFMNDILPSCSSIEAYLENRMEGNLVTMTKSISDEAKQITKWNNISTNYSWTFNGNLAGKSQIKQAVKIRGGNVEACVRISIHFPNTTDDYDLHCIEPNSNHIFYGNKRRRHNSSGMLDLDAQGGDGHFEAEKRVENLTWTDKSKMPSGTYELYVDNYSKRGLHTKFNVEVEIDGDITILKFTKTSNSKNAQSIGALIVKNGDIEFTPKNCVEIDSKSISKELWELETNKFHKVNLVCKSPNHWGENEVGNLHYFFMIDKCKANGNIRAFHNENLLPELLKHKKVMEVLGAANTIEPTVKQLSGIGFNSTVKDELIVKCSGNFKRMLKIKF